MNKESLEDMIVSELSPIRITRSAFDKANYISKRVCEVSGKALEIGFLMTGSMLNPEDTHLTITDMNAAVEQNVQNLRCEITPEGTMTAFEDSITSGKRIIGWGHSHAKASPYYTEDDDNTIKQCVQRWGLRRRIICPLDLDVEKDYSLQPHSENGINGLLIGVRGTQLFVYGKEDDIFRELQQDKGLGLAEVVLIKYFYGMTFNALGDTPYNVVAYISDGQIGLIKNRIDSLVIDDGHSADFDKVEIDRQMVRDVIEIRERAAEIQSQFREQYGIFRKRYLPAAINAIDYLCSKKNVEASDEMNILKTLCEGISLARRLTDNRAILDSIALEGEEDKERILEVMAGYNILMKKIGSIREVMESNRESHQNALDSSLTKTLRNAQQKEIVRSYDGLFSLVGYQGPLGGDLK